MKQKPRIVTIKRDKKDKIIDMVIKDRVKKIGKTGFISLNKELIDKYVMIRLEVIE